MGAGRLREDVFERARGEMHATLTPWLVAELKALDVAAVCLPFDGLDLPGVEEKDLSLPSRFSVLSYIPDERWSFYGGAQLVDAARRLPQVEFTVVAGQGGWLRDTPANVRFLGWRNDMVEVYKTASVVLRLAEHDALGCTVLEGLSMARHVLYNYPVPYTTQVAFDDRDGLVAEISGLWARQASGALSPNFAGKRWAESEYDEERLIATLCKALAERQGVT